jgi:hypothetical protein
MTPEEFQALTIQLDQQEKQETEQEIAKIEHRIKRVLSEEEREFIGQRIKRLRRKYETKVLRSQPGPDGFEILSDWEANDITDEKRKARYSKFPPVVHQHRLFLSIQEHRQGLGRYR